MDVLIALLRVAASVVVVTALAYYGTRWLGRQANRVGGNNSTLRMESSLSLGGRRYLGIVEADGRRFLVAVTDQQVGLIAELDGRGRFGLPSTQRPSGEAGQTE